VGLAALCVEAVGVCRDIAEQAQRMGREPKAIFEAFNPAVAQALRVV